LLPAHWIEVDLATGTAKPPVCWWQPTITERSDISFADATDELRQRFLNNVALHLRSDVPIGAALSGGVDSSAVVCAMRHLEPDLQIRTFSYIAQGSSLSEENWIDRINDHVQADPFKVVASAEELGHDLTEMIKVQGEPVGSTSIYAQYRVFQLAREQGVTVTLDGQGADELLAGYAGYPGPRLRSLLETGHPIQALKFLFRWAQWPGRSLVDGTKYLARELTSGSLYQMLRWMHGRSAIPSWIQREQATERGVTLRHPPYRSDIRHPRGRSVAAALATALTRKGLTKLLRHGDRNSMRFSVESRVPFLTAGLADFLLSLPESYLISPNGETKRVFRAAMRGIVPDDILDRKDKIGFATPESEWMRQALPSITAGQDFHGIPLIDGKAMKSDLQLVIDGRKRFEPQIWRRVCFTQWYRLFFLQSNLHSAAA